MDLLFPKQTAGLVLFDIVLMTLLVLMLSTSVQSRYKITISQKMISIFLMFVYIVFAFNDTDWFHYQDLFLPLKMGYPTHVENIYYWIVQNLSSSYLIFRVIIWGTGLFLLFYCVFRKLPISWEYLALSFVVLGLMKFAYARVSVSMVMTYMGLTLYYTSKSRISLKKLFGVTLILSSFYFHKSAIFGILIAFVVILSSFVNKKLFYTFLIALIPLMVILLNYFLVDFLLLDVDPDSSDIGISIASGQKYMDHEKGIRGIGSLLGYFLERVPYYLIAYMCYEVYRKEYDKQIPANINVFLQSTLCITVFTSLLLFDFNVNMNVLYNRFLRFAAIPASVSLAYFWQERYYPKLVRFTFYVALAAMFYSLLYSFYNIL